MFPDYCCIQSYAYYGYLSYADVSQYIGASIHHILTQTARYIYPRSSEHEWPQSVGKELMIRLRKRVQSSSYSTTWPTSGSGGTVARYNNLFQDVLCSLAELGEITRTVALFIKRDKKVSKNGAKNKSLV